MTWWLIALASIAAAAAIWGDARQQNQKNLDPKKAEGDRPEAQKCPWYLE
jgi:hypothetical protein